MRHALAAALLLAAVSPATASETDYLPSNESWNGLSDLLAIARSMQLPLELTDRLDWSELEQDRSAVLIWLYPRTAPPADQIVRFVEAGGRLLIADDHGAAGAALAALAIRRYDGSGIRARRYLDGNRHLPVARRAGVGHPLVDGVDRVVTNHPAYFLSRLPTLLGFDDGRQQLLVAGEVGKGRFVALSDPSVLINNMLRYRGNLRLTRNILGHLATPGQDRLVLLTGHVRLEGQLSPPGSRGDAVRLAREFNGFVGRLNDFALTSSGMRALAFVCSVLVVAVLALLLPMPRRDLDGHWIRPAGSRDHAPDGAWAAAVLREEIEERLTRLLDAPGPISAIHPRWLVARVRERAGAEAAQACARLLDALRQVPYTARAEDASFVARIGRRDLATIHEQSARLLRLLGDDQLSSAPARRQPEAADARPPADKEHDR